MKEITLEDSKKLYDEFIDFCNQAQPNAHDYGLFIFLDMNMVKTIAHFEKYSQEELRSMFRTILRVMGRDYSMYEEVIN